MTVIKVDDIHKKFRVFFDKSHSLKERLLFRKRNRFEDRWVLQGISFEVERGEALGLIGKNGCGKSTLLKLMTKIMYPDKGTIDIKGRVSSLIELGAGFHPDMSGRENIYTNASIFGLSKQEIDHRLKDIIDFSELEEFIDNPVRTYSSGMYMRLAFSVAINVDADVLLIDEILAVGDANFQSKCYDRLRKLKASGVTIVIVTHDTTTIERFCTKAMWINDGKVVEYGHPTQVVDQYLAYMNEEKFEALERTDPEDQELITEQQVLVEKECQSESSPPEEQLDYTAKHFGLKYAEIIGAGIRNASEKKTDVIKADEAMAIEIEYVIHDQSKEYVFGIGLYTLDAQVLYGTNTQIDNLTVDSSKKTGRIRFQVDGLPLVSGEYILQVAVVDVDGTPMDFYREYSRFHVINTSKDVGIFVLPHRWLIL